MLTAGPEQIDSFLSIAFTSDPELWKTDFAPPGKLKEWLLADRKGHLASYMTDKVRTPRLLEVCATQYFCTYRQPEELGILKTKMLEGGFEAPLCWYKAILHQHTPNDEKGESSSCLAGNPRLIVFMASRAREPCQVRHT